MRNNRSYYSASARKKQFSPAFFCIFACFRHNYPVASPDMVKILSETPAVTSEKEIHFPHKSLKCPKYFIAGNHAFPETPLCPVSGF